MIKFFICYKAYVLKTIGNNFCLFVAKANLLPWQQYRWYFSMNTVYENKLLKMGKGSIRANMMLCNIKLSVSNKPD